MAHEAQALSATKSVIVVHRAIMTMVVVPIPRLLARSDPRPPAGTDNRLPLVSCECRSRADGRDSRAGRPAPR